MQESFSYRAKVLITQRRYQEAIDLCREGLAAAPDDMEGKVLLGMALLALRQYDQVCREIEPLTDAEPSHALAHRLLGEAHLRLGHTAQARHHLEAAKKAQPDSPATIELLEELERGRKSGKIRKWADPNDTITITSKDRIADEEESTATNAESLPLVLPDDRLAPGQAGARRSPGTRSPGPAPAARAHQPYEDEDETLVGDMPSMEEIRRAFPPAALRPLLVPGSPPAPPEPARPAEVASAAAPPTIRAPAVPDTDDDGDDDETQGALDETTHAVELPEHVQQPSPATPEPGLPPPGAPEGLYEQDRTVATVLPEFREELRAPFVTDGPLPPPGASRPPAAEPPPPPPTSPMAGAADEPSAELLEPDELIEEAPDPESVARGELRLDGGMSQAVELLDPVALEVAAAVPDALGPALVDDQLALESSIELGLDLGRPETGRASPAASPGTAKPAAPAPDRDATRVLDAFSAAIIRAQSGAPLKEEAKPGSLRDQLPNFTEEPLRDLEGTDSFSALAEGTMVDEESLEDVRRRLRSEEARGQPAIPGKLDSTRPIQTDEADDDGGEEVDDEDLLGERDIIDDDEVATAAQADAAPARAAAPSLRGPAVDHEPSDELVTRGTAPLAAARGRDPEVATSDLSWLKQEHREEASESGLGFSSSLLQLGNGSLELPSLAIAGRETKPHRQVDDEAAGPAASPRPEERASSSPPSSPPARDKPARGFVAAATSPTALAVPAFKGGGDPAKKEVLLPPPEAQPQKRKKTLMGLGPEPNEGHPLDEPFDPGEFPMTKMPLPEADLSIPLKTGDLLMDSSVSGFSGSSSSSLPGLTSLRPQVTPASGDQLDEPFRPEDFSSHRIPLPESRPLPGGPGLGEPLRPGPLGPPRAGAMIRPLPPVSPLDQPISPEDFTPGPRPRAELADPLSDPFWPEDFEGGGEGRIRKSFRFGRTEAPRPPPPPPLRSSPPPPPPPPMAGMGPLRSDEDLETHAIDVRGPAFSQPPPAPPQPPPVMPPAVGAKPTAPLPHFGPTSLPPQVSPPPPMPHPVASPRPPPPIPGGAIGGGGKVTMDLTPQGMAPPRPGFGSPPQPPPGPPQPPPREARPMDAPRPHGRDLYSDPLVGAFREPPRREPTSRPPGPTVSPRGQEPASKRPGGERAAQKAAPKQARSAGMPLWKLAALLAGALVFVMGGATGVWVYLQVREISQQQTEARLLLTRGNYRDYAEAAEIYDGLLASHGDDAELLTEAARIRAVMALEFGTADDEAAAALVQRAEQAGAAADHLALARIAIHISRGELLDADRVLQGNTASTGDYAPELIYLRGLWYLRKDSAEDAMRRFAASAEASPGDVRAALAHARALHAAASHGEALTKLANIENDFPQNVEAKLLKAKILIETNSNPSGGDQLAQQVIDQMGSLASPGEVGWARLLRARRLSKSLVPHQTASQEELAQARDMAMEAQKSRPVRDPEFSALLALTFLDLGSPVDARTEAENAVKFAQENDRYRLILAEALVEVGELAAAEENLRSMASPSDPKAALLQGRISFIKGDLDAARSRFEEATRSEREGPQARLYLARIHLKRSQAPQAIELLKTLTDSPAPLPEAYTLLGEAYLKNNQLDDAQRALEQAEEKLPGNPLVLINLGKLYSRRGAYAQALGSVRKALSISPGNPEALTTLGTIHLASGDRPEAGAAFDQVLEQQPDNVEALLGRTRVATADRDFEKAQQLLTRAEGLTPPEGPLALAQGELKLERYESSEAASRLEVAVKAFPDDPAVLALLADAYVLTGSSASVRKARSVYGDVLKLRPEDPHALIGMAEIELGGTNQSKIAAAVESAERSLARATAPASLMSRLYNIKGRLALEFEGSASAARELFSKALALDDFNAEAHLGLGFALQDSDSAREACPHFQRYIDLAKQGPEQDMRYAREGKAATCR